MPLAAPRTRCRHHVPVIVKTDGHAIGLHRTKQDGFELVHVVGTLNRIFGAGVNHSLQLARFLPEVEQLRPCVLVGDGPQKEGAAPSIGEAGDLFGTRPFGGGQADVFAAVEGPTG